MSHCNDFVWQALEEMGEKETDSMVREIESSLDKDKEGMLFHRNFQGKHSYEPSHAKKPLMVKIFKIDFLIENDRLQFKLTKYEIWA